MIDLFNLIHVHILNDFVKQMHVILQNTKTWGVAYFTDSHLIVRVEKGRYFLKYDEWLIKFHTGPAIPTKLIYVSGGVTFCTSTRRWER